VPDDALEDELREQVRRACAGARAEGTIAARLAEPPDPRRERRWQQLGLLYAGLPEPADGVEEDVGLAAAVAEECGRDLLSPPSLLRGLWAARALTALAADSPAALDHLARALDDDVPAVCWPGVTGGAGDLHWDAGSISGSLPAVPAAGTAGWLLVVLPDAGDGVRVGAVELGGAVVTPAAATDPTRPLAGLTLDGLPVRLLGSLPTARARRLRAAWLLLAAADSLGAMRGNLDLTLDHVQARRAFGRPIGAFQAVRHRCVDLYVDVETTRAAVRGATSALRRGEDGLADALVAVSHAVEAQVRVAESATLLHGALGFTYECDAHFYLRRAYAVQAALPQVRELRIELAHL
jgi:alkylation response protein AidB-like acyl-CoA dehydrogenase